MKKLSQLFVLVLSLALPLAQAGATEASVKAAIDGLHSELAAAKSKAAEGQAARNFMEKLTQMEKSGMDRTEIVRQLKTMALDHQTEAEVDALVAAAEAGVLSKDEVLSQALDIAKRTEATGAAYSGSAALYVTGALLVILGVVAIAASSDGYSYTYYDPYYPYCYYDYYGYYYCY